MSYLDLCPYGSQNCLNLFITEYCVSVFLCFRWQSERETTTGTEKWRTLRESIISHENNNICFSAHLSSYRKCKNNYLFFPAENILPSLQNLRCDADQVCNKTVAAKKGFLVSDNQASGNCLFYALSEQLKSVKGIQISHKELRNTLVQFLRENANLVRRLCGPLIVCLTSSCWGKKWQKALVSPIKSKTTKPIW